MAEAREIITSPLTLYVAPEGTAFPLVDAAPAVDWFKFGTKGDKSYADEGVTIGGEESIESFRGAGSTLVRKAWRTEEEIVFQVTLVDFSPDQIAKALNDATVTTTAPAAGVPGQDAIPLTRGADVSTFALLARGPSSVMDAPGNAQFQIPLCYQVGAYSITFGKSAPAGVLVEFRTLDTDDTPELIIQTAAAI